MYKHFFLPALLLLSCGNDNSPKEKSSATVATVQYLSDSIINNKKEIAQGWKEINKGLFLGEFNASIKSTAGNSVITILKIDPAFYKFSLVSAKEKNEQNKTAKEWAKQKGLIAVINAGMFRDDGKTNTGFMQNYKFQNNEKLNSDKTIIAFNPKDKTLPEFQIIDLECQDWEQLKNKYNCYAQGIRMIDCNQNNKWQQQDKKWSMVSIATDKKGNVLFIFTRSPYSVHDFIEILLKLPIDVYNAEYLEGGPEASLYLNYDSTIVEKFGSYETGFNENDGNDNFWEIPNVIGISKK